MRGMHLIRLCASGGYFNGFNPCGQPAVTLERVKATAYWPDRAEQYIRLLERRGIACRVEPPLPVKR